MVVRFAPPLAILAMPKSVIFARLPFEQDDVRRLDVAMHDPFRVREVERLGDLRDDVADLLERQRPPLREHFLQVLSLDVLHGDERHARWLVLTDVVDGDDRGMIEDAGGLRLAHEALLELAWSRRRRRAPRGGWSSARRAGR